MLKLNLENISKSYRNGETVVALNKVSLGFRKSEFVSIFGPSGCGKTTLLNVIGGLDQYDSGDLVINGLSTREFTSSDWDAYRNRSIGFVFQSYNLIGHQTVLQNVEIALTLSGVSAVERRSRALQALADVGLADQIKKKPNQLSGGQMQRVAIARALVNDPDIILADEPTGALDSHTSVQIMEILKEISEKRLVIMVTHNASLADEYSNRIIRLLDGEIQSDSNPITEEEINNADTANIIDYINRIIQAQKKKLKKTSMSLKTATSLSFRNLLTKKGRTITTAFAGSIGIIGVALVLALSNGLSLYMSDMQSTALSGYPIAVSSYEEEIGVDETAEAAANSKYKEYPSDNSLIAYDESADLKAHTNILTQDYLNYVGRIKTAVPNAVNSVSYTRGLTMNVLAKGSVSVLQFDTVASSGDEMDALFDNGTSNYWQELPDDQDFILSMYDLIGTGSRLPENKNEVLLVVDSYNRIDKAFLEKIGISKTSYSLTDFIGKTMFSVVLNNEYYTKTDALYKKASPSDYSTLFNSSKSEQLTITGILRVKKEAESTFLSQGIAYRSDLTNFVVDNAKNSDIAIDQKNSTKDVVSGVPFANDDVKKQCMLSVGADTKPTGINIYPRDYSSKDKIKSYLDEYNEGKAETNKIIYSDMAESITTMTSTLLKTVTYVLTGFAAIALLVSTIMIGIITYVSVIERTKEIGILRSVGARKKDISRVFNAEALIIGFTSGVLGIIITYILTIPANSIIYNLAGITGIANLSFISAIALILGSMVLTLIAGFFPSRMAANKDPVTAIRTE